MIHPEYYRGGLYNDVALLFLSEPVEIAENVNIACLPSQYDNFDHARCFASGWGRFLFSQTFLIAIHAFFLHFIHFLLECLFEYFSSCIFKFQEKTCSVKRVNTKWSWNVLSFQLCHAIHAFINCEKHDWASISICIQASFVPVSYCQLFIDFFIVIKENSPHMVNSTIQFCFCFTQVTSLSFFLLDFNLFWTFLVVFHTNFIVSIWIGQLWAFFRSFWTF